MPGLRLLVAHPSVRPVAELAALPEAEVAGHDAVLTTYGTLERVPWVKERAWGLVVLDEAQAIKNPSARQSRAVKALRAQARVALTGTPVENRLGDLWSLFDFLDPGLLGTAREFSAFTKRLAQGGGYGPLRELVRPYLLRRMKTDPAVVADLPDKVEARAECALTPRQAALYQEAVDSLKARLERVDGMERRGLVLALLTRLQQVCNHPSHWLGMGGGSRRRAGSSSGWRSCARRLPRGRRRCSSSRASGSCASRWRASSRGCSPGRRWCCMARLRCGRARGW